MVKGISLITLLWSDGDRHYPTDYRIYHKTSDGLTKNDHFAAMLKTAKERGFRPEIVLFDSWYGSIANLKQVRALGWAFLTRFKTNRKVRIGDGPALPLEEQDISAEGTIVWLPKYGEVKVFRLKAKNGLTTHWATNALEMEPMVRLKYAEWSWSIEEYHRGLKQFTGVDRCQCRSARAQRNHIGGAIRAFV